MRPDASRAAIQPDFLSNFGSHVDRTVSATDGCSGATGAHEIYFNAQARALAPVRLTGNFAAKCCEACPPSKPIGLEPSLIHADFRPKVDASAAHPVRGAEHPVIFAAFREIPWSLFGPLAAVEVAVVVPDAVPGQRARGARVPGARGFAPIPRVRDPAGRASESCARQDPDRPRAAGQRRRAEPHGAHAVLGGDVQARLPP